MLGRTLYDVGNQYDHHNLPAQIAGSIMFAVRNQHTRTVLVTPRRSQVEPSVMHYSVESATLFDETQHCQQIGKLAGERVRLVTAPCKPSNHAYARRGRLL